MNADYTWKETVARLVLQIIEISGQPQFTIEQVYEFENLLQAQFPQNQHVREKTRQSLQKLVADGLLLRTQRGIYHLNISSSELNITTESALSPATTDHSEMKLPDGNPNVKQVERITRVRLRNTILAIELKKAYQYKCQVCQYAVPLRPPNYYAEGHHLRPLGNSHNGPDVPGNILVLCPNHHTMFDAGAAAVEPKSLRLLHWQKGEFDREQKLMIKQWHHVDPIFLAYHYTNIFNKAGQKESLG